MSEPDSDELVYGWARLLAARADGMLSGSHCSRAIPAVEVPLCSHQLLVKLCDAIQSLEAIRGLQQELLIRHACAEQLQVEQVNGAAHADMQTACAAQVLHSRCGRCELDCFYFTTRTTITKHSCTMSKQLTIGLWW